MAKGLKQNRIRPTLSTTARIRCRIEEIARQVINIGHSRQAGDTREVSTRNSKTFTFWLFPVGEQVEAIVVDWIRFLTTEKFFGPVGLDRKP